MVADIAAAAPRLSVGKDISYDDEEESMEKCGWWKLLLWCLQALFHSQGLSVVCNVDNIFPRALMMKVMMLVAVMIFIMIVMMKMMMSIMIFMMMMKLACAVFPRFGFAYLISEGHRKPPSWERSCSSLNLIWSWNDHDNFDHDHDYHDKEAPEQNLWFLVQVLGLPCGCWWLHSSGRRCRLTLGLEIVMTMMMIMMRRMMIMMRRRMIMMVRMMITMMRMNIMTRRMMIMMRRMNIMMRRMMITMRRAMIMMRRAMVTNKLIRRYDLSKRRRRRRIMMTKKH